MECHGKINSYSVKVKSLFYNDKNSFTSASKVFLVSPVDLFFVISVPYYTTTPATPNSKHRIDVDQAKPKLYPKLA